MKIIIKNQSYTLSKAYIDDLKQIVELYNQGVGTANADFEPVSVQSRQAWFMAHGDSRPLVVIKDNDKVAAWASLSNLYDRPAYCHSTEISVYVDTAYHGKGLGAYLVQYLMDIAPSLQVSSIVALIFGHNHASLNLFKKLGFEQWGLLPKVCLSQGQLADVVFLGRVV